MTVDEEVFWRQVYLTLVSRGDAATQAEISAWSAVKSMRNKETIGKT